MSINKYNAEGYYDPTAYEALSRIERESKKMPFRPLVYICSPYSGDVEKNVKKAREHCRFALNSGCIPIAMHLLLPQFMDDNNPKERDLALFIDLVIMGKCQEVWVFGDRISDGMAIEIAKAKKRGQGVKYFGFNYKEVSEDA
jgi:hypothetical protein